MYFEDVLLKAQKYGIISFADVRSQIEMIERKRKEILSQYHIWCSKDGKWYTYVYSDSKRRLVKRTSRQAIEDYICSEYTKANYIPSTFEECYKEWRKIHDRTLSNNSIVRYETDYNRFFKDSLFSHSEISKLSRSDIEAFIFEQIRTKKLCQSAAKKLFEYIHCTMLYALEKEWIARDPMQFMHVKDFSSRCYISKRQKKPQTISHEDSAKILEQVYLDRIYKPDYIPSYAVEFAMLTAMRVGEIAALRWTDVQKGHILVVCSEKFDRKSGKYYIDDTKNRSQRLIPVTKQMEKLLYLVKERVGESEFVFGGIHADTISSCMENKCKQAKVQYHGIHACRKTINSNMKMNGVGGTITCSILGNTEEVNAKYYTFDTMSMEDKREILEKASMVGR